MFKLKEIPEQSFRSLEKLHKVFADQDRQGHQIPLRQISLDKNGMLRASKLKLSLTPAGLDTLLNTLNIPVTFGKEVCSPELLCHNVNELVKVKNDEVKIHVQDDIATGVMPADRQPIRHEVLIDWLGLDQSIEKAIVSGSHLRITALTKGSEQVLPGEEIGYGWELQNDESGWGSMQARGYSMVLRCTNGMVDFETEASFLRKSNSRKPVMESLEKLSYMLEHAIQRPDLKPAIGWAANNRIGQDYELAIDYVAQKLEGKTTKLALGGLNPESTWYQLLNTITSLARIHRLEVRRKYEAAGGTLVRWYMSQGRSIPPWRKMECEECSIWSNNQSSNHALPTNGHEVDS